MLFRNECFYKIRNNYRKKKKKVLKEDSQHFYLNYTSLYQLATYINLYLLDIFQRNIIHTARRHTSNSTHKIILRLKFMSLKFIALNWHWPKRIKTYYFSLNVTSCFPLDKYTHFVLKLCIRWTFMEASK